ncbi:hypothetical protein Shyd_43240 [Streptomyces hydrogenans]|uniref:Uncharacterized protein n=1 Tax=Streptomyces hydrogenans TaxID=1873719 RepID=A0ABQ3PD74_9ACTN|nr:hypothetical protein Shyd_43240 [Streptomyces hydrogenans]
MKGDWLGKFRRERRGRARVRRAAWRLEQAERERAWALVVARAEGLSVRMTAEAAGLSPSRVHQLTKDAEVDALGELRAAGWPAPEDPEGSDDEELSGRASIAERLVDEVGWIRQCADWIDHLDHESYPPAPTSAPRPDFPDRANVVVDFARVSAILRRIAFDVDELARARNVGRPDRRPRRRRSPGRAPPPARRAGPGVRRVHPQEEPCRGTPPGRARQPGTPTRPNGTTAARRTKTRTPCTTRSGPGPPDPAPPALPTSVTPSGDRRHGTFPAWSRPAMSTHLRPRHLRRKHRPGRTAPTAPTQSPTPSVAAASTSQGTPPASPT